MLIFRFAWRNLHRNFSRSFLTGLSISLGLGMCIGTLGIMEGLNRDLIVGITSGQIGHIQIHHPRYLSERKLNLTIDDASFVQSEITAAEGVKGVSGRLYSWGYLSKGGQSIGVQLMGLNPDLESGVTKISTQIITGSFIATSAPWRSPEQLTDDEKLLDSKLTQIELDSAFQEFEGVDLGNEGDVSDNYSDLDVKNITSTLLNKLMPQPDKSPEIVIGSILAHNLSADVGDELSLLYESSLGSQASVVVKVVGISKTGETLTDRTRAICHLNDLQSMMILPNQVHEFAISLGDPKSVDRVVDVLTQALSLRGILVESWSTLRPDILALITSNKALMGSLVFIIFLISGMGVMNSMFVSVSERQKELSVLKAVGVRAKQIVFIVMLETIFLILLSSVVGLLVGAVFGGYLSIYGWDISNFGEFTLSGVGIEPILRASITTEAVLIPLISVALISFFSAFFPAFKAARVSPAGGMRSY